MVGLFIGMILADAELGRPYLDAALKAEVWIQRQVEREPTGSSLYSGSSGKLLFACELLTASPSAARQAYVENQAKDVAASTDGVSDAGLYTGLAGVAYALDIAATVTKKDELRLSAKKCIDRVVQMAKPAGAGVQWNDSTDIISGSAGIGCVLLWAADSWKRQELLAVAKKAGDRLLELSRKEEKGISWAMSPDFPRQMPNFSHGTAGVAYFLASLYQATKENKYLDAAKAGATYLQSVTANDGLIFHHEPDGRSLFYLGWCHGPTGTARLFAILHKITKEKGYAEWIDKAASTMLTCGIPDTRAPGYWNNWGLCCGDAGVLRFYLDLYRLDAKPEHLRFARRLADFLIAKAEKADAGLKWTVAENRVGPEKVAAQTGLMQGAAGIGLSLLWLDAVEQKRDAVVRMPDAPWRW